MSLDELRTLINQQADLMVDGNSATQSVVPFGDRPLSELLHNRQVELVQWFEEQGYDVEFK